jgi:hypothetical protein
VGAVAKGQQGRQTATRETTGWQQQGRRQAASANNSRQPQTATAGSLSQQQQAASANNSRQPQPTTAGSLSQQQQAAAGSLSQQHQAALTAALRRPSRRDTDRRLSPCASRVTRNPPQCETHMAHLVDAGDASGPSTRGTVICSEDGHRAQSTRQSAQLERDPHLASLANGAAVSRPWLRPRT